MTTHARENPRVAAIVPVVTAALGFALHFQGQGLLPYAAALALLCLALALVVRWPVLPKRVPIGPAGILLAALLAWTALSLSWTAIPYLTTLNIGMTAGAFAAYLVTRSVFSEPASRRLLALALIGLGLLTAATMVLQAATGMRPDASFLNPNTAAAFVNLLWPIPAVLSTRAASSAYRCLLLTLVAIMLFAIGLDGGRGAFIAGVVVLFVIALGEGRTSGKRARVTGLVLVWAVALLAANGAVSSGLFPGARGDLAGRALETIGNPESADASRWAIWQAAWQMIEARPLLGHGPGTFFQIYPSFRLPADQSAGFHVHNDYLQFWLELGLPGFLLILGIGAVCARPAWRIATTVSSTDDAQSTCALIAASVLAGLAVHSLVSYNLQVMVFLLMAGIGLAFLDGADVRRGFSLPVGALRGRPLRALALYGAVALSLTQLGTMAWSHHALEEARRHVEQSQFSRAKADFDRARRLWNNAEPAWTGQAGAYLEILDVLPADRKGMRRAAKAAGLQVAAGAQRRNPYRTRVRTVMARLHMASPDRDLGAAARFFRQALRLDPRSMTAIVGLARVESTRGRIASAREAIKRGLQAYGENPPPVLHQLNRGLQKR